VFTGIVQAVCAVRELRSSDAGARLVLDRALAFPSRGPALARGDSVAVAGVCLTLVDVDERTLAFDVVGETLRRTTLGALAPGERVNVEPSLTPSSFVGGHFVAGHVDGVGTITAVVDDPGDRRLAVRPPADVVRHVVPKGSIAIDGVSLTVAATDGATFEVALIPETLERTTLGAARQGARVNLETDLLVRTVVHWLERTRGPGAS
jgi:riboflavin synthase